MSKLDRRTVSAALAAAAFTSAVAAAKPVSKGPQILFICQFGTVKSAIARELLKRRSSERGLFVNVASRGITPEEHLSPDVEARLSADGIDPRAEPLRKLEQRDLDSADLVILFDRLPEGLRARNVRDWTDLPSMLNRYPEARADLDRRIDQLLDQLAR